MAKVQIKSEKLTHFVFFRLPFKQTIIQCTKIQNILGPPLLIVSAPIPHHVSLLLKCFLLASSPMTKY